MGPYMWREPGSTILGGGMTRMVKILILVNIGVFVLQMASGGILDVYLGLSSVDAFRKSGAFRQPQIQFLPWQFVTYMFLHSIRNLLHLVFNMFMLWMFGRELESLWGEKAFLRFYLTCGVGAGIASYLATFGDPVITIGASGAIFGILVAYAVIFPERLITVFILIFPLPPMKAKHVVMIFAGLELLFGVSGAAPGIAHFAHLGGGLVGYIYLKMWRKRSFYGGEYRESILARFGEVLRRWSQKQDEGLDREVDKILAKISKTGVSSLTRREKSILDKKSKKK